MMKTLLQILTDQGSIIQEDHNLYGINSLGEVVFLGTIYDEEEIEGFLTDHPDPEGWLEYIVKDHEEAGLEYEPTDLEEFHRNIQEINSRLDHIEEGLEEVEAELQEIYPSMCNGSVTQDLNANWYSR